MQRFDVHHAEDVSSASGAVAFNMLSELVKLPPSECHRRLADLFFTAIAAYFEFEHSWAIPPMPSNN